MPAFEFYVCLNTGKVELQNALDHHKSIWESNGINNYRFTLKEICNCMMDGTHSVTIKNNTVDTVISDTAMFPAIDEERYVQVPAIDEERYVQVPAIGSLFKFIQDGIDENAEKLTMVYNGNFGYPEKIEIDMSLNSIDDEYSMEIPEFIKQ